VVAVTARPLHREGAFAGAAPQLQLALDGLPALCTPERGARRTSITKDIMVALQVEFGPACARFVHANLGPIGLFQTGKASDGDSTRRKPQYEQMTAVQGEDEIALQGSVDYHPQSDSLVGFCGPSPDGDASVYNRILDAFNTQKVATQGRVVMIVPHSE
jgi:hypothetical protein